MKKYYKGTVVFVSALLLVIVMSANSLGKTKVFGLEDCIKTGLENNFDIKKFEYERDKAQAATRRVGFQYEPYLNAQAARNHSESLLVTIFPGAQMGGTTEQDIFSLGIGKKTRFGGMLSLSLNRMRDEGASILKAYNPLYQSTLGLYYSQPLLKNFTGINDRRLYDLTFNLEKIAGLALQARRNSLKNAIEKAYWQVVFAKKNLEIQTAILKRKKVFLEDNRIKFADGLLEEVSIITMEASIAMLNVSILQARDGVTAAEENLQHIMNLPEGQPVDFRCEFPETIERKTPDQAGIIAMAVSGNLDLKMLSLRKEISAIQAGIKKNEKLPDLDMVAQYGLNGQGDSWNSDYESMTDGDYKTWYIGLKLDYTPLNRGKKSLLKQAELDSKISAVSEQDIKKGIMLRCRNLARGIETAVQFYDAASESMKLQKKKLELEEKKFSQGRSSSQLIMTYQDDLGRAEIEYYRSIIGYRSLVADLELITGAK